MVVGLAQTSPKACPTCSGFRPLNLPEAVETKYWIIQPATVV